MLEPARPRVGLAATIKHNTILLYFCQYLIYSLTSVGNAFIQHKSAVFFTNQNFRLKSEVMLVRSLLFLQLATIDIMRVRKDGTPQSPLLMWAVTLSIRIGTAAYFSGKQADDILGRYGHWLKHFFEITRGRNIALRIVLKRKNAQNLIGIGGQYIVFNTPDQNIIEKYSHTLAGADPKVLLWVLDAHRRAHQTMQAHFGDMLQSTQYDLGKLPIRGPAKKLTTLRARQQNLPKRIDLFSEETKALLVSPAGDALRAQLQLLHTRATQAMKENVWLDLIGPENVVISNPETSPQVRIIDIEPYVPEYLNTLNPITGKTYKETFLERLAIIEKLAQK